MDALKHRNFKKGPEKIIQEKIIDLLRTKGWYVKIMHGSVYQFGFPDLFASHYRYGIRLIEVKNPEKYAFTPAQLEEFPKITANGAGIWILTAATDREYEKLFTKPNWYQFLSIFK